MLAPIATLIVGLSVAYVAWQQWNLSKAKLRLDLFDRRYKIYEATKTFLLQISSATTFSHLELVTFYAGTADAQFLFDSDVVDYLALIRKRAVGMTTHKKVYERLPEGEERSRHVEAEADDLVWLHEQLTAITKVFNPYLSFSHIK